MYVLYDPALSPMSPVDNHHIPGSPGEPDAWCEHSVERPDVEGAVFRCTRRPGHDGHHLAAFRRCLTPPNGFPPHVHIAAEWDDAQDWGMWVAPDPVPANLAALES